MKLKDISNKYTRQVVKSEANTVINEQMLILSCGHVSFWTSTRGREPLTRKCEQCYQLDKGAR